MGKELVSKRMVVYAVILVMLCVMNSVYIWFNNTASDLLLCWIAASVFLLMCDSGKEGEAAFINHKIIIAFTLIFSLCLVSDIYVWSRAIGGNSILYGILAPSVVLFVVLVASAEKIGLGFRGEYTVKTMFLMGAFVVATASNAVWAWSTKELSALFTFISGISLYLIISRHLIAMHWCKSEGVDGDEKEKHKQDV